jgi:hypothetical protein
MMRTAAQELQMRQHQPKMQAASALAAQGGSEGTPKSKAQHITVFDLAEEDFNHPLSNEFKEEELERMFWHKRHWKNFKKESEKASVQCQKLDFLVDIKGNRISEERQAEIMAYQGDLFSSYLLAGRAPRSWDRHNDIVLKRLHRRIMAEQFEELRFCEKNWKIDAIAIIKYTDWIKIRQPDAPKVVRKRARQNDTSLAREMSSALLDEPQTARPASDIRTRTVIVSDFLGLDHKAEYSLATDQSPSVSHSS